MRMRVVEADDLQASLSRLTPGIEVPFRIEEVAVGILRHVPNLDRFGDLVRVTAQQHAATLEGPRALSVRDDRVQRRAAAIYKSQ